MRSLALLLLLAPLASAQGAVHVVGSGGAFSEIQPAIDAAADGDVVLVRPGAYDRFTIGGKGVAVIADTDAEVLVEGQILVHDVPAGSLAVLRGLATSDRLQHGLRIEDCAGAVRVEECTLAGDDGFDLMYYGHAFNGALVESSASVLLSRCTLIGGSAETWSPSNGGSGVRVWDASVAIVDCTLIGGDGGSAGEDTGDWGGQGGDGVTAWSAHLWVGGCTAHGGDGGDGSEDYDLFWGTWECGAGGYGGSGVRVITYDGIASVSSTLVLRDFTASPGAGGGSPCTSPSPPGKEVTIYDPELHDVTMLPGDARGTWASSPARAGTNARVYVRGEPGDLAIVAFGAPAPYLALPGHPLPLATAPQATLALGAVPAGGVLQHAIPVPSLGSGIDGLTLGLQSVVIPAAAPWEIAPFGSITLLGPGF